MKLYIYKNEEIHDENNYPEPVAILTGEDNAECEASAESGYGSNDYTWSYSPPVGVGRQKEKTMYNARLKRFCRHCGQTWQSRLPWVRRVRCPHCGCRNPEEAPHA